MKSLHRFFANETFLPKLVTTILTLAVVLAISSPPWILPFAVKVVSAIITGALFSLSINRVSKLDGQVKDSIKLAERANALTELIVKTLESYLAMTNKPVNHESLKNFYFSIQDIYIHFMDEDLIDRFYQNINDNPIPSKVTQEFTQSDISSSSTSISVPFGKIIDISGQLKSDRTETEKKTLEGVFPEVSIERKVLDWQSVLIHQKKVGLGYEYCSWQLTQLEEATQQPSKQTEEVPDIVREIVRLMGVNGFILINGSFSISDCELQDYYELSHKHPLNVLDDQVNVNFRIRIPKSKIPKQISDNSYFDETNISVIVLGYVNQNQYDGIPRGTPTFINVNPIVVYSTPTMFSDNQLMTTLIEKGSLILNAHEEQIESLQNEIESKDREYEKALIEKVNVLEAKVRDLESQEKYMKTVEARNQE